jgi:endonuclease YncB( thermonuclease family)
MRKHLWRWEVKSLLLGLLLSAFCLTASADTITGKVVGVTDGDTVTVLDAQNTQHKIRLAGIDAPEKGQPFGSVSKESLSDLAYGQTVNIEWQKRDKYGRLVGKIIVGGEDANLEQVLRGLAWHYKEYAREQSPEDQSAYASAEESARSAKTGLWAETEPVPPWAWRKMKREVGKANQSN